MADNKPARSVKQTPLQQLSNLFFRGQSRRTVSGYSARPRRSYSRYSRAAPRRYTRYNRFRRIPRFNRYSRYSRRRNYR